MKKRKLTKPQAVFVLSGMLATIKRIQEDCHLTSDGEKLSVVKAKSGILGLQRSLKGAYDAND